VAPSTFQSQNGLILVTTHPSSFVGMFKFQSQNGLILVMQIDEGEMKPNLFQSQNGLILVRNTVVLINAVKVNFNPKMV